MPEMAMTARCGICGRLFAGPQLVLLGKGVDAPNNRLMQFVQKLTAHLVENHKKETEQIFLATNEYQGMLFLSHYQTESAALKTQLDMCRWKVHQGTLAARFTDAQIADWVEKIVPDLLTLSDMRDTLALSRNLAGMLMSMRDRLEEPGKYTFSPFDPALTGNKAS
jgi:hypothetical protein